MKNQEKIRVMLADDHEMVRYGLSSYLQMFDDIELVGEVSDGIEAVQEYGNLRPDIVLMDMVMPRMDGVEATREICRKYPGAKIIAITSFDDEKMVQEALKAGVRGYLYKNITMNEIGEAIRKVHSGQAILSPEALEALIHNTTSEPRKEYGLTSRECEILTLMVSGLSNPEIAERLFLSRATVASHVRNILNKLNVKNRSAAVAMAVECGLLN